MTTLLRLACAHYSKINIKNLPDRSIKGSNAQHIPLGGDPAPKRCVAIDSVTLAIADKDVNKGRDERNAVAAKQVGNFHSSQSSGVELEVKGQVHVDGHGERPESICR